MDPPAPAASAAPMFAYLRRRGGGIALGVLFLTLCNFFELAQPRVWKGIVDRLGRGEATSAGVLAGAGLLMAAALGRSTFSFLQRVFLLGTSRRIEYDLRGDFFAHLQRLPPSYFVETKTGDLMSRATSDVNAVRVSLGMGVMLLIDTINLLGVSLFFMATTSWQLTLVAMAPLLLLPFLVARFSREIHRRYEKVQEHVAVLSAHVQESLAGVRVVKAFVQEAAQAARFGRHNEEFIRRVLREARVSAPFNPLLGFCAGLGVVSAVAMGGWFVATGRMGLGDFVAFDWYLAIATGPMGGLGILLVLWQKGKTSMGRLQEVMRTRPDIADAPDAVDLPSPRGAVSLRGLTVRHPGADRPAIDAATVEIPAGAFVGVVGPVGAGKSTLAAALARLVRVPDGQLFVDGVDINRVRLAFLRAAVATVPQDTFLFSDTVRNNIAFGRPDASDEEVARAARLARIDTEIAALPRGYEQGIGERGVTLSGGQRQRVAIARAVLCQPAILVLDNAMSSVDAETEEALLAGLRGFLRGRTTIAVSHRVAPLRDADLILVMDSGRIVERGTDAVLRAAGGAYARLCALQEGHVGAAGSGGTS